MVFFPMNTAQNNSVEVAATETEMSIPVESAPLELDDAELLKAREAAIAWLKNRDDNPENEDIAQEAVICAWLGYSAFTGDRQHYEKWFRTIVRNKATDNWRSKQHRPRTISFEVLHPPMTGFGWDKRGTPQLPDPENSFIEEYVTTKDAIGGVLNTVLKRSQTGKESVQILIKHRLYGETHKEIADELDISIVAIKARLHKIRQCIARVALGDDDVEFAAEFDDSATSETEPLAIQIDQQITPPEIDTPKIVLEPRISDQHQNGDRESSRHREPVPV